MSTRSTPLRSRSSLGRSLSELRPPSFSSPARAPSRSSSSAGSRSSTPSFSKPFTGSIKVAIRGNPAIGNSGSPWHLGDQTIANVEDGQVYQFDQVFADLGVSNRQVYVRSCQDIVSQFVSNGYNATIFAYGMTGSGKTWTMNGSNSDPGVVRLAIDQVFDHIQGTPHVNYTLTAQYFEIYNEKVVDLLNPGGPADLQVRNDAEFGTKVIGVAEPEIKDKQQLIELIKRGENNRRTGTTDYNTRSSRSHSILQLKLKAVDGPTTRYTTLSLCDLAGSEKAVSQLERRKEGSYINKSLLALGTVIAKLSTNNGDHIPYRDSKLTRLLQPALSGSALVSILCTIHLGSTTPGVVSETSNTLRFATRAKAIEISVKQTKSQTNGDSAVIAELRAQVAAQKQEIDSLKGQSNPFLVSHVPMEVDHSQLEAENRILNEKLEHFARLNDLRQTEKAILKNDAINEILGLDYTPQQLLASLEEYHRRVHFEMSEHKSYIRHLESELRVNNRPNMSRLESKVREKDEEIWALKETIKDKDHVIKNMMRTANLRRMVERGKENSDPVPKRLPLTPTKAMA